MGFHVYNTPNQALKAEKLAEVLSYISEDFAGVIADDWDELGSESNDVMEYPTWIPYPQVNDPTGSPKTNKYYEWEAGIGYFPSKDESVVSGKTYYTCRDCWRWNSALWNKQITFIGGGINIGYDVPEPNYLEDGGTDDGYWPFPNTGREYIYGLDVIVPADNASIASDAGRVWLTWASYNSIEKEDIYTVVDNPSGNPQTNNYYEYSTGNFVKSSDTSVVSGKVYYYVIKDEAISVKGAIFVDRVNDSPENRVFLQSGIDFKYYGNTVWLQKGIDYNGNKVNRFFIPLCYRQQNSKGGYQNNSVIFRRNKKSYNSFLSARTYYNLLSELSSKFVYRSGGEEIGNIGKLNVTGGVIKRHDYDDIDHVVSINRLHLTGIPVKETTNEAKTRQYVSNMLVLSGVGEGNNDENRKGYKKGRIYRTNDNWVISLRHGGTSAVDRDEARKNLNFYKGHNIPTRSATKGQEKGYYYIKPVKVNNQPDYGAVWFRIL